MSLRNMFSAILCSVVMTTMASANLTVTGTFDGPLDGGEPKVVELYATADIADLSLWAAGAANNGGGTDGPESILSGSVSAGTFLYIIDDNSDSAAFEEFNAYFSGQVPAGALLFDSNAGSSGGAAAINGDDAIEVFSDPSGLFTGGETVVDVFGDINVDGNGQPWEYLDGWAYRNDLTGPDGSTFVLGNWSFSDVNANDGQTSNATAPMPFPIGTYNPIPEPASFALFSVALLSLGAIRRK